MHPGRHRHGATSRRARRRARPGAQRPIRRMPLASTLTGTSARLPCTASTMARATRSAVAEVQEALGGLGYTPDDGATIWDSSIALDGDGEPEDDSSFEEIMPKGMDGDEYMWLLTYDDIEIINQGLCYIE